MPASAGELLEGRPQPTVTYPHEPVQRAIQLMVENDFSQLPVVDSEHKPVGLISADSILRGLVNLAGAVGQLRVRDVMEKHREYGADDGIFDLLESLNDCPAVLITDGDGRLTGIITNWDTAEYFRRRAADMMLIEDIETALKDHIQAGFTNPTTGLLEESELQNAIDEVVNTQPLTTIRDGLIKYLSLTEGEKKPKLEIGIWKQVCDQIKKTSLTLDDMTFYQLTELFLHRSRWNAYGANFGPSDQDLRSMLSRVQSIRNKLAHFRGEIEPEERKRLGFCASWFERNPAIYPVVAPSKTEVQVAATAEQIVPLEEESVEGGSRYERLRIFLQSQSENRIDLTLADIEQILGISLPPSARQHRSWWANDTRAHVQSRQWLEAGWRVAGVSMSAQRVTFARTSEREQLYISFFSSLMNRLKKQTDFPVRPASPDGKSWHTIGSFRDQDRRQVAIYAFSFTRGSQFRVELYIDTEDEGRNKTIFDQLQSMIYEGGTLSRHTTDGSQIVNHLSTGSLRWERLDHRRASRVALYREGSVTDSQAERDDLCTWAVEALIMFQREMAKALEQLGYKYSGD